jgi:hypothetical protein
MAGVALKEVGTMGILKLPVPVVVLVQIKFTATEGAALKVKFLNLITCHFELYSIF